MASSSFCILTISLKNGKEITWAGEDGDSPFFQVPNNAEELLTNVHSIDALIEFILKCASAYEDFNWAKEQYLEVCKEFNASLRKVSEFESIRTLSLSWAEFDPSDEYLTCEMLEYNFITQECRIRDDSDESYIQELYDNHSYLFEGFEFEG